MQSDCAIAMCAQSVEAHLQSDGVIAIAMCAQSVNVQLQSYGAIVIASCAECSRPAAM